MMNNLFFLLSAESETDAITSTLTDIGNTVEEVKNTVASAAQGNDMAAERLNMIASYLTEKLIEFGGTILTAIFVAVIGWYIIKFISKTTKKMLIRSRLDDSVSGFLSSLISMILKIILLIVIVATLGIDVSTIAALFASAGLAIGLALQGCLSNFAGGVLILVLKPFTVGDYIVDSNGNEGTVTAIEIIYTKLLTADNRAVTVPNGALSNATITNVTKEPIRRIDFNVSIDYDEDISKVKNILLDVANQNDLILKDQKILAMVNKFDPSAIDMMLRVWVKSEDYWTLKAEMPELIKLAFDKNDVVIPFDKLDVNLVKSQSN